jgi:soluble lytic murein transglycosylase-like protein
MTNRSKIRLTLAFATIATIATSCPASRAAERVILRNGFELDCARRETAGDRVRLYLLPASAGESASHAADNNYIEVAAASILRTETIPDPPPASPTVPVAEPVALPAAANQAAGDRTSNASALALSQAEMHELLARAGASHNIDADLLASLVHAESNFNPRAVSRAGAQGLMQLMPGTASDLGVANSFAPEQNIGGGTAYLDQMLSRYHDNIALALAAYNAGPAAVDRYRGIPPYAETRAYVARVIREFNRLKILARATISQQIATTK